jgi:glutamate-1-semialdehyde 2,1-aminomutase
VDGNRYVDLVCSWGPLIAGHAHPRVVEAVQAATARGTSFGAPTEAEVELAEEVARRVPAVEKLRMVTSGTEATMSAARLARAATGRPKLVKFAGCYHGHADALLAAAGSGVATLGLPDSPGVTGRPDGRHDRAPYNDPGALAAAFAAAGDQIAAVHGRADRGQHGGGPADARRSWPRCGTRPAAPGAPGVLDEVMTGFRVHRAAPPAVVARSPTCSPSARCWAAGCRRPPTAAGRAARPGRPEGPVYQAGTLSGNPLATAAGLATLSLLDDDAYRALDGLAGALCRGSRRLRRRPAPRPGSSAPATCSACS